MRTTAFMVVTFGGLAVALTAHPVSASELENERERIMEEAAASLPPSPILPGNSVYMLERRSEPDVPFWSKMAVVLGYTNNKEACTLIAKAMQQSSREKSSVQYDCRCVDRK